VGIPVSIVLVAAGAILAFAVNKSPNGVDVHTVGWILLIIGIVGLLLTLLFWDSWWGGRYVRRSYAGPPGPPARRRAKL
jgi:hypothetical protein